MSAIEDFETFLSQVDLDGYRNLYSPIKLVELDLPREIQALKHIYNLYWHRRSDFLGFEDFYEIYSSDLSAELEAFRVRTRFSKETFSLGLPARIYRTWASLLTQVQAGYVAETVCGENSVEMSAGLDWQGIDMRVRCNGEQMNIQVKKETLSREVRMPHRIIKNKKVILNIIYEVPGCPPLTPTGKESTPFNRWQEKWSGKLARLDNGFIIFLPGMFDDIDLFEQGALQRSE